MSGGGQPFALAYMAMHRKGVAEEPGVGGPEADYRLGAGGVSYFLMTYRRPFYLTGTGQFSSTKARSRPVSGLSYRERAALFNMTNTLLLIAIGLLVTLIILAIVGLNKLGSMNETWERTRDKLATISSGIDKLDAAVDWWLGREGLKLDYMSWRWIITSKDDNRSLYRTLAEMDKDKREALARALYEANLQALRDFDKEQAKKKAGGKK